MRSRQDILLMTVVNLVSSVLLSVDTHIPVIIAHRGSSGMFPEHTALAYRKAIEQGADYIECDVELTKDLELICSHEPWLSEIIDKSLYPEFASRERTYEVMDDDPNFNWNDKFNITDWFSYDFTLPELITMRRIQRLDYRDPSYNNIETFCTFQEYINIAKSANVGIYPEFKFATFTNKLLKSLGHDVTIYDLILKVLLENGYKDKNSKCFLQTFERSDLEYLKDKTMLKRVFLMGSIWDEIGKNSELLKEIQDWAMDNKVDGFGVTKDALVRKTSDNHIEKVNTKFVEDTHAMGKQIHVYTFRNEYMHLVWEYGQDPYTEYDFYYSMGIDGYFSDFPRTARQFLKWKDEDPTKCEL